MGNKTGKTTISDDLNDADGGNLKKRRSQSITWSFRYSSLKKQRPPSSSELTSQPHLDIIKWLEFLDLKQYEGNFRQFSGVEKLLELTESDIKKLGIKNSAHRARIVSNLVALREKQNQRKAINTINGNHMTTSNTIHGNNKTAQRHSVATTDTASNRHHYSHHHHSHPHQNDTKDNCPDTRNNNNNNNKNDSNSNNSNNNNMIVDRSNRKDDDNNRESSCSIYEILNTNSNSKQSKSCGDLLSDMMDPTSTEAQQQQQQQQQQLQLQQQQQQQEAIALKKALEWELSLDSRDLRSHAWYHGGIQRQRAEEIVQKEGDFLIRDCASQPGNYVLTCRTKTSVLHFVINKILIQPETVYERVQYQFEDDAYDTVPDLITFYVGSGKPISVASGARIQFPCNRTYPLSFYGNKFHQHQQNNSHPNSHYQQHHQHHNHHQQTTSSSQSAQLMTGIRSVSQQNSSTAIINNNDNNGIRLTPYNHQQGNYNSYRSPMSSPPRTKRETPPRLPSKKQRSQSLTPIQGTPIHNAGNGEGGNGSSGNGGVMDKYCSSDGIIQNSTANGNSSLPGRLISTAIPAEKYCSADGVIQANQQNGTSKDIMIRSADDKSTSADGVINHSSVTTQVMSRSAGDPITNLKFSSHSSISRTTSGNLRLSSSRTSSLNRDISDTSLSPCLEQNHFTENDDKPPSPPPKPSRTPGTVNVTKDKYIKDSNQQDQQHPLNRVASYHASGSDSGNGSGDSAQSSAVSGDGLESTLHRGVVIKNPRFMTNSASSATLKSFSDFDVVTAEQELANMDIPIIEQISKFDLENFHTLLLPAVENKPLDNSALNTFRMMLAETGPRILAQHLTRIDIKLILDDTESPNEDSSILDCTGLELITLPHGQTFRQDLIERTQCIKLLVAVTILTCQSDLERAETLNKWIQVAVDTKTALGNLFGFCAIMLGLCMPQIQKLESTWHILRQKFTDSAFTFEAKLRPTLKSMNDCSNPQAPNTTVPHLLPYILLKDRGIDEILALLSSGTTSSTSTSSSITNHHHHQQQQQQHTTSLNSSCISSWEINSDDFGISILFSHLDSVRNFTKNLPLYKRNAQIIIEDSNSRLDELLLDAFRTEFHIKFLWGSKGAIASAEDRHTKLEQVLALMAEKFCTSDHHNKSSVG